MTIYPMQVIVYCKLLTCFPKLLVRGPEPVGQPIRPRRCRQHQKCYDQRPAPLHGPATPEPEQKQQRGKRPKEEHEKVV